MNSNIRITNQGERLNRLNLTQRLKNKISLRIFAFAAIIAVAGCGSDGDIVDEGGGMMDDPPLEKTIEIDFRSINGTSRVFVNNALCDGPRVSRALTEVTDCMNSEGTSRFWVQLDRGLLCAAMQLSFEVKVDDATRHSGNYEAGPCVFGSRYYNWYFTVNRDTGNITNKSDEVSG